VNRTTVRAQRCCPHPPANTGPRWGCCRSCRDIDAPMASRVLQLALQLLTAMPLLLACLALLLLAPPSQPMPALGKIACSTGLCCSGMCDSSCGRQRRTVRAHSRGQHATCRAWATKLAALASSSEPTQRAPSPAPYPAEPLTTRPEVAQRVQQAWREQEKRGAATRVMLLACSRCRAPRVELSLGATFLHRAEREA
jgi:hypothetical protein